MKRARDSPLPVEAPWMAQGREERSGEAERRVESVCDVAGPTT